MFKLKFLWKNTIYRANWKTILPNKLINQIQKTFTDYLKIGNLPYEPKID